MSDNELIKTYWGKSNFEYNKMIVDVLNIRINEKNVVFQGRFFSRITKTLIDENCFMTRKMFDDLKTEERLKKLNSL